VQRRVLPPLLLLAFVGGSAPLRAVAAPVSAPAAVAVTLGPVQDVSFPFWCDWGYDWEERCYRDDSDRLPIGGDVDKVWRAGLRFDVSGIPAGAEILDAALSVYHDGTCLAPRKTSRTCPARSYTLGLHEIYSSDWFHEREVEIGPEQTRAVLPSAVNPAWLTWDVTALVAGWVAGSVANNGALLKLVDEQEDYEVTGPKVPSSTFANVAVRPALDVTYLPRGG
jgi:hypothetical protein